MPLFLVETHLLARLAGSLEALPTVLGWASYATLVLAMAVTGHLVAWETGRPAHGLAAMAAVASRACWVRRALVRGRPGPRGRGDDPGHAGGAPGVAGERARGGRWPWPCWRRWRPPCSGRPGTPPASVGMAYLWADGRRSCRRAGRSCSWPPRWSRPGSSGARRAARSPRRSHVASRPLLEAISPGPPRSHTAQAICEALVLNNLGLDAATTAGQAIVLVAILAGALGLSRRRADSDEPVPGRWPRVNPLEAAGAALVVANFGMIFAVRGTETTFDNLRALGWYDAIPQLGAVLFVCRVVVGTLPIASPRSIRRPRASSCWPSCSSPP